MSFARVDADERAGGRVGVGSRFSDPEPPDDVIEGVTLEVGAARDFGVDVAVVIDEVVGRAVIADRVARTAVADAAGWGMKVTDSASRPVDDAATIAWSAPVGEHLDSSAAAIRAASPTRE